MTEYKTLTVRMPTELYAEVEVAAVTSGKSLSAFVRESLGLSRDANAEWQGEVERRLGALERMAELS